MAASTPWPAKSSPSPAASSTSTEPSFRRCWSSPTTSTSETELEYSVYELVGTLADGSPLGGQLMFLQNDTGNGAGATFNLLPPPVPEPSTLAMAVLGCVGALAQRRRPERG